MSFVTAVFGVCTCVQCVVYKASVTTVCSLTSIFFLSCRLLKTRLEKEEFEGRLKDVQDSLLIMKKQTPAPDGDHSSAEVILMSVTWRSGDYARCVGETQALTSSVLHICIF